MKNHPVIDPETGKEAWISRSLAVSALIYTIDRRGKRYILANKRGQGCEFNKGLWNVPGGFIDYDEDARRCAQRETYEETGFLPNINSFTFMELDTDPKGVRQTMVVVYRAVVGEFTYNHMELTNEHCEPGEVEEIKWICLDDLDKYKWTHEQVKRIRRYAP